jgi:hypothetical protein
VPYEDQECRTVSRDECQTLYRDNCYDDYKDARQTYTEDECKDEVVNVCEKGWVEQVKLKFVRTKLKVTWN